MREIPTEHWDKFEQYIRAGGQDPVRREVHLIDHITALTGDNQELRAKLQEVARAGDELADMVTADWTPIGNWQEVTKDIER